jgi:tetratricopeptide (TPR) repeat protein
MLALEQATADVGRLPRDVRVPLVAMLTAAYAALGKLDQARKVAYQVAEGEERDRAFSRLAVAVARNGDFDVGLETARRLADDDERDWTLDELAHLLADTQRWDEAQQLAGEISAPEQRAQTLANLAIASARMGDTAAAVTLLQQITTSQTEYARAILFIAPLLVARDEAAQALTLVQSAHQKTGQQLSRDQVSRSLASIVAALAERNELTEARRLTAQIEHPDQWAQAHVAIALAAVRTDADTAFAELAQALQVARLGRDEAFRVLMQSVPIYAELGGAPLLQELAAVIDEVDAL